MKAPDGIEHKHIHEAGGSLLRRWPLGLLGLFLLLVLSFFGTYGSYATFGASGNEVSFTFHAPGRIRNGEFFEMVLDVELQRDVRDLVVLVDHQILRDMTVNTYLPEPAEHGFRDGAYEFRYGSMRAGDNPVIKYDGQMNPGHLPGRKTGRVTIADGDTVLAGADYSMEVLP